MSAERSQLPTIYATALVGAFVSIAIAVYVLHIYQESTALEDEWAEIYNETHAIEHEIYQVQKSIGYNGFIHNFKNYVIRRDPVYAQKATADLADAYRSLNALKKLIPGTTGQIEIVEKTLKQYQDGLVLAVAHRDDTTVVELDNMVKVNDGPATIALAQFQQTVDITMEQRTNEILASIDGFRQTILFGLGAIFLAVASTAFMTVQIRKTSLARDRADQERSYVDRIMNSSPEAMLVVDGDGIIHRANKEAQSIFGYTSDELIGRNVDTLVPSGARKTHKKHRDTFQAPNERTTMGRNLHVTAVTKTKDIIPVDVSLASYVEDDVNYTIAVITDISQRLAEIELVKDAQQKAEAANATKSIFLANMSHEIRTPLTGMLGVADYLMTTPLDKEQKDFVHTLQRSGKHLQEILNDILDLSKLEENKLSLVSEPFVVSALTETTVSVYSVLARSKSLNFDVEIDEKISRQVVVGDLIRLRQILLNLVGNAIKYTIEGGVKVSIDITRSGQVDKQLTMRVNDTGVGIAEEKLRKIFDPFEQIDNQKNRTSTGTGLGLAICKRLVELMDGSIDVTSIEGVGTIFTVHIPIALADHSPTLEPKEKASASAPSDDNTIAPIEILVADDNAINRKIMESMLAKTIHHVDFAQDGEDAITKLRKKNYDLALIDIHMPKADGIEVFQYAQQNNCLPGKTYAFTADVMSENIDQYRRVGFDGAIPKPIEWKLVEKAIQSASEQA